MTVAFWQVVGRELLEDVPGMMRLVDEFAEGELRLAAARDGAEIVDVPVVTRVPLYRVEAPDRMRLEPAVYLRVIGLPVPDQPDAVLVRWEQETRRRVWNPVTPTVRRRFWRRR